MKNLLIYLVILVALFMTTTHSTYATTIAYATPINDTDLGLKSMKIDGINNNLTENQKLVKDYYDNDYFGIDFYEYEFLPRYPQLFEDTQIGFMGVVKKIISSKDDNYELLVWVGMSESIFLYRSNYEESDYKDYMEETKDNLVVVKGKQSNERLIVGDTVKVYGTYNGIDVYTIDLQTYTIPTIYGKKTTISDWYNEPLFEKKFITKVAKAIWGNDVKVRDAIENVDYDFENGFDWSPFMICEIVKVKNPEFTKYRFCLSNGFIEDTRNSSDYFYDDIDNSIHRTIEFTPDFQHFLQFVYDADLKTITLEYYDVNLNLIWKREFEHTSSELYDYTKNNIYLVSNSELFIINMETGEDIFEPSYVGERNEIKKLHDGILLAAYREDDAIIKTDLKGNIQWKINFDEPLTDFYSIQLKGETIVMETMFNTKHFLVINSSDGTLVMDVEQQQLD